MGVDLSDYITTDEAAKVMDRRPKLVRELCRTGRLEGVIKFGKAWLVPRKTAEGYKPAKRGPKFKTSNAALVKATLDEAGVV